MQTDSSITLMRRESGGSGSRTEWVRVATELEQLCDEGNVGDRIPTHLELMRQMNASQRAVLRALGDLQRRGRIERRHGSGTYISGRVKMAVSETKSGLHRMPGVETRHIVAVAQADNSFFDLCINLLYTHAQPGIDISCRLVNSIDPNVALNGLSANHDTLFIVFQYRLLPIASYLQSLGYRVVLVGTPPVDEYVPVPVVYGDQNQGGYLACNHVIDSGHKRIAFAHPVENMERQLRWSGHQRAIEEASRRGIAIAQTLITKDQTHDWLGSPDDCKEYFSRPDAPTAIVAWNDHEALALMGVLTSAGIRVPEDVTLVGYDGLPASAAVVRPLTTVDGMVKQQIDAAVRLLVSNSPLPDRCKLVVSPSLSLGATTQAR